MIDIVEIKVKAGNGGDGNVTFRRAKFVPKGGPDGGDGGDGGSIYIKVDSNKATLADFHNKQIFEAVDGEKGKHQNMTGASAVDLYIKVPEGTLVYEIKDDREVLIGDLIKNREPLLVAQGGRGGKGNVHFKSSINQTPYEYTEGTPGEEKTLRLEVKLVADVGFIGMPNAGKSTLINILTNANAKVGSYPFTTTSPNLGVWELAGGKRIIIADIPGLIEGASQGKGLGYEFLRHIERTRILVHLIDPFTENMDEDLVQNSMKRYDTIRTELKDHGADLENKPEIVVINKLDITEIKNSFENIKKAFKKEKKIEIFGISAVTGEGLDKLSNKVQEVLEKHPNKIVFKEQKPVKIYTIDNIPNRRMVFGRTKKVSLEERRK